MINKPCFPALQLNNEIGYIHSIITSNINLPAGYNIIPLFPYHDIDCEVNSAGKMVASRDKFLTILLHFRMKANAVADPNYQVVININSSTFANVTGDAIFDRDANDNVWRTKTYHSSIYVHKGDIIEIAINRPVGAGNIIIGEWFSKITIYDILSSVTNKLRIGSMCQYQADTDLVLPNAVLTNPLIFNTLILDSEWEYVPTTGIYTASRNKWVDINIQLSLATNLAGASYIIAILRSFYNTIIDKDNQKIERCNSVSSQLCIKLNYTKYLNKNDTIDFKIFQQNDAAIPPDSLILGASFPAKCDFTIKEINSYAIPV